MDRSELKRTLHEQFVPFEQAVFNKLNYLQGDDVFTAADDEPIIQNKPEDDTLENAFNMSLGSANIPVYKDFTAQDIQTMQNTPQPQYTPQEVTKGTVAVHKENMAARIAALRGISLPGDYLRKK